MADPKCKWCGGTGKLNKRRLQKYVTAMEAEHERLAVAAGKKAILRVWAPMVVTRMFGQKRVIHLCPCDAPENHVSVL